MTGITGLSPSNISGLSGCPYGTNLQTDPSPARSVLGTSSISDAQVSPQASLQQTGAASLLQTDSPQASPAPVQSGPSLEALAYPMADLEGLEFSQVFLNRQACAESPAPNDRSMQNSPLPIPRSIISRSTNQTVGEDILP